MELMQLLCDYEDFQVYRQGKKFWVLEKRERGLYEWKELEVIECIKTNNNVNGYISATFDYNIGGEDISGEYYWYFSYKAEE